ncbi:cytidylyltransferase domain-containing protein [Desulfolutivibrio sulfoxidireducens]|uniref:acylneuraminate cytidylyltransferase family protein n=1 Tax=Desulfolutivibrio sulfoxidireducens TaxID=2773299 RepID=UPI00159D9881|nr:NTP transferase domain-containing protein [Desulfolutivibrio sulfoxidireducens]QLA18863.1 NTP transferase domain-containing protein [Desulfolutivibrio sulfoxidireducens]
MRNIVILTAKGGNLSIPNKNILPVLGVPVMLYPLRAAKMAMLVDKIYVTTEDQRIKHLSMREGASVIDRPAELSTATAQHKDVIRHAVEAILQEHPEAENFIVLLGNTVMLTPSLIDTCFSLLDEPDCDSVATVWKAQDDHPFRAMIKNEQGYMESFMGKDVSSNRQSYPDVFYYDQGVWAFKGECALKMEGPSPWIWLGRKCRMLERLWVTGRDIHSWIDVAASTWYLTNLQLNDTGNL